MWKQALRRYDQVRWGHPGFKRGPNPSGHAKCPRKRGKERTDAQGGAREDRGAEHAERRPRGGRGPAPAGLDLGPPDREGIKVAVSAATALCPAASGHEPGNPPPPHPPTSAPCPACRKPWWHWAVGGEGSAPPTPPLGSHRPRCKPPVASASSSVKWAISPRTNRVCARPRAAASCPCAPESVQTSFTAVAASPPAGHLALRPLGHTSQRRKQSGAEPRRPPPPPRQPRPPGARVARAASPPPHPPAGGLRASLPELWKRLLEEAPCLRLAAVPGSGVLGGSGDLASRTLVEGSSRRLEEPLPGLLHPRGRRGGGRSLGRGWRCWP